MNSIPYILRRKIRSFARSSLFEQLWLVPAWVMLGLSRLVILLLPFRYMAPYLGLGVGISSWIPLLNPQQQLRALQIGRVIRMATQYTPWDSNCFPQAITASLMLRCHRIPYAMFLGVAHGEKDSKMRAHAWVDAGAVHVTGGSEFAQFVVVGCFVDVTIAKS